MSIVRSHIREDYPRCVSIIVVRSYFIISPIMAFTLLIYGLFAAVYFIAVSLIENGI